MPSFTERSKKTKMFKGNSVDLGLAASKNLIIILKYFFSDQRVELAEKERNLTVPKYVFFL